MYFDSINHKSIRNPVNNFYILNFYSIVFCCSSIVKNIGKFNFNTASEFLVYTDQ